MMKLCLKAITHRLEFMLAVLLEILLAIAALLIAIYGNNGAPAALSQPAYQSNLLFSNALGQVIVLVLMPLCISLCCGDCLFLQMQNGLYQLSIIRTGRRKYWCSFLAASALAGSAIAVLPFLLSIGFALLAFPLDSGAGYLHYVGYRSTMLYAYDYTGHAWTALADSPYLMIAAMILLLGVMGALYAVVGCLLTPLFRKNRILAMLVLPAGILVGTFGLQSFSLNRFVWFNYFVSSPELQLDLKDLGMSLGIFALVAIGGLGIRLKVCRDEIS